MKEIIIKQNPVGISATWFPSEAIKGLVVPARKHAGKYFVQLKDLVQALRKRGQHGAALFWEGTTLNHKKKTTSFLVFQ